MIEHHEFNRDRAVQADIHLRNEDDPAAIVQGLFAIADRLADLTEVFAAASDAQEQRAPVAAGPEPDQPYPGDGGSE